MSNLQYNYQFKLDSKWSIHGTKRGKDNQLQNLEPNCKNDLPRFDQTSK